MIGVVVIGAFAGMCLLRAGANLLMRRDDASAARRRSERCGLQLAEEAQAWLDQRPPR